MLAVLGIALIGFSVWGFYHWRDAYRTHLAPAPAHKRSHHAHHPAVED